MLVRLLEPFLFSQYLGGFRFSAKVMDVTVAGAEASHVDTHAFLGCTGFGSISHACEGLPEKAYLSLRAGDVPDTWRGQSR